MVLKFSLVHDDRGEGLNGDGIKVYECRLIMEVLEGRGVRGTSGDYGEDDDWQDIPSSMSYCIEERGVFVGFLLEAFFRKPAISVCKFYELYFYMWIMVERWITIVEFLEHRVCQFESGIVVAAWLIV